MKARRNMRHGLIKHRRNGMTIKLEIPGQLVADRGLRIRKEIISTHESYRAKSGG